MEKRCLGEVSNFFKLHFAIAISPTSPYSTRREIGCTQQTRTEIARGRGGSRMVAHAGVGWAGRESGL